MKKRNCLQTIDDILTNELTSYVDYSAVLRVIYCYYLNDSEREMYNAALLYYGGKTQKDIGILLNMHQAYFNERFYKLIDKMRDIADVLYYNRDIFTKHLGLLKQLLLPKQYAVISFLFGGNSQSDIAKYRGYDIAIVTRTKQSAFKLLSKDVLRVTKTYLDVFKKTKIH